MQSTSVFDPILKSEHAKEVRNRMRFAFGSNWTKFLATINEARIQQAVQCLQMDLGVDSLQDKQFLDVGCGSGLQSLAARRMGAKVVSFDNDPEAVACVMELKKRYAPDDSRWDIEHGSVLDVDFVADLGLFDVVYAFGVLHHTGSMWRAVANTAAAVRPGGKLLVAIHNDQGAWSDRWRLVKRTYRSGTLGRAAVISLCVPPILVRSGLSDLARGKSPLARYRGDKKRRGMSPLYDTLDWLGGYPFEVAKPEDVFMRCQMLGLQLVNLKTNGGGAGCNEFLFQRPPQGDEPVKANHKVPVDHEKRRARRAAQSQSESHKPMPS